MAFGKLQLGQATVSLGQGETVHAMLKWLGKPDNAGWMMYLWNGRERWPFVCRRPWEIQKWSPRKAYGGIEVQNSRSNSPKRGGWVYNILGSRVQHRIPGREVRCDRKSR
jgi:hypothetical protein